MFSLWLHRPQHCVKMTAVDIREFTGIVLTGLLSKMFGFKQAKVINTKSVTFFPSTNINTPNIYQLYIIISP